MCACLCCINCSPGGYSPPCSLFGAEHLLPHSPFAPLPVGSPSISHFLFSSFLSVLPLSISWVQITIANMNCQRASYCHAHTRTHTHTHTHTQTHRLALMITDQRLFGWTGNMFYFKVQFRGLFSLCIDNMMGNYYYMSYHVVPL